MVRSIFKDWNSPKWIFNILILIITIYLLGSMINITFAIGYILMLVIHEMGHMMAAYGYGAQVRFGGFTPFGAYMQILNQTSLKENAVIAISGPLCGLVMTLMYYFLFFLFQNETFLWLSFFTGFVSLINLLPLDPFDGGKVAQGTCWYLPLIFLPFLGYGILRFFQLLPLLALLFAMLILYIIRNAIQMQKRHRIEMMLCFEKPHRLGILLVYLVLVVLLGLALYIMFMNYGFQLFPQTNPITLPAFL